MLGTMLRTISVPIVFPTEAKFENTMDGWSTTGTMVGEPINTTATVTYSTGSFDGSKYLSASVTPTTALWLSRTITMPVNGHMKLWVQHDLEGTATPIDVFIDGVMVAQPSISESTWEQVSIPVSTGTHEIVLRTINSWVNLGIDSITFGY